MLYPDFTANIAQMPLGAIDSDYNPYDVGGIQAKTSNKFSKKRGSKDHHGKKQHSRVNALNQTEYFLNKQKQGAGGMVIQNPIHEHHHLKPLSTRHHVKAAPVTAANSRHGDEGFLMFDQTSDMGGHGIHYGVKSNGPVSLHENPPIIPPPLGNNTNLLPVQVHAREVVPLAGGNGVESDSRADGVTPDQLSPINPADDEPIPTHISPSPPPKG